LERQARDDWMIEWYESRASQEGPEVYLEVLEHLRLWVDAPAELQDLAVAEVARRLGSDWIWLGTSPATSFKGLRLARFRLRLGAPRSRAGWFEAFVDPFEKFAVDLVLLPGGRCWLGQDEELAPPPLISEASAAGRHSPALRAYVPPFLLAQRLLIQRAWDHIGGEDLRRQSEEASPIHGLSWDDAELWMAKAGGGLRFPSELELEYAARGAAELRGRQAARRSREPDFGIEDLNGEHWQWTQDEFFEDLESPPPSALGRGEASGYDPSKRALRGAPKDWSFATLWRIGAAQSEQNRRCVLRVARSLPEGLVLR
jgi:hypothetical protein